MKIGQVKIKMLVDWSSLQKDKIYTASQSKNNERVLLVPRPHHKNHNYALNKINQGIVFEIMK